MAGARQISRDLLAWGFLLPSVVVFALFIFWPLGPVAVPVGARQRHLRRRRRYVGLDTLPGHVLRRRVRQGARHDRAVHAALRGAGGAGRARSWCCCWRRASAAYAAAAHRVRAAVRVLGGDRVGGLRRPSTTRRSGSRTACSGAVGIDRVSWLTDPSSRCPRVVRRDGVDEPRLQRARPVRRDRRHPAGGGGGGPAGRRHRLRAGPPDHRPAALPAAVLPRRGLHDPRAAELRPDPHPHQGRAGPGHHHAGLLDLRPRRSPTARRDFGAASAQAIVLLVIMLACTAVQFGVLERRVHYR